MAPPVAVFLNRVTEWALSQPTMSGIALVGSHATAFWASHLVLSHVTTFLQVNSSTSS
jgi:hypothetical protein